MKIEEIETLKKVCFANQNAALNLVRQLEQKNEQLRIARDALEFYSNNTQYDDGTWHVAIGSFGGAKAREALAKISEMEGKT